VNVAEIVLASGFAVFFAAIGVAIALIAWQAIRDK
jgi:hypothetical protein